MGSAIDIFGCLLSGGGLALLIEHRRDKDLHVPGWLFAVLGLGALIGRLLWMLR